MRSDSVLLTIHGIVSDNSGLAALAEECRLRVPQLITECMYYHRVIPFYDLTDATQKMIFKLVYDEIELAWHRHVNNSGRKFFILAHSFGTLALIKALEMHIPHVQIDGLILLGSIIPRAHVWDGLIRTGQLRCPPLAVIRPFDLRVRAAGKVGGEDSGRIGFIRSGQFHPYETFKNGGHKSYFPDDVEDVVTAITKGIPSVPRVTYSDWKAKCTWGIRILHAIVR